MRAESAEYHSEPSYWLQMNAMGVPLNRTNVMVVDYAYDVPRSVCWDGVLEHCVTTCTVECVQKVRDTTLNQATAIPVDWCVHLSIIRYCVPLDRSDRYATIGRARHAEQEHFRPALLVSAALRFLFPPSLQSVATSRS